MLRLPCLRHTKLEFNAPSYFWKVQRFRYRKLGRFDSERPVHPNFAKCYSVDYRAMGRLQCPKGSKLCCVKQYARTFCPVDCINCIFQYFHYWRYIYFSLRKLCCCSCVFPSDKKSVCESQWIGRFSGTELSEGQRVQLDTGVRESNASIQSGSCFGRIDGPCVIDWVAIQHVGGFSKERASFAARASLHSG